MNESAASGSKGDRRRDRRSRAQKGETTMSDRLGAQRDLRYTTALVAAINCSFCALVNFSLN